MTLGLVLVALGILLGAGGVTGQAPWDPLVRAFGGSPQGLPSSLPDAPPRGAGGPQPPPPGSPRPRGPNPFATCPVLGATLPPEGGALAFGAPRPQGGSCSTPGSANLHAGVDLVAPMGTPVRAPFGGFVTPVPNPAGGNAVHLRGREGYAYLAHFSRYGAVGPVRVGTIIGYVGESGGARGTIPHCHFEWHPNRVPAGARVICGAIDAEPFLRLVCSGGGPGA